MVINNYHHELTPSIHHRYYFPIVSLPQHHEESCSNLDAILNTLATYYIPRYEHPKAVIVDVVA